MDGGEVILYRCWDGTFPFTYHLLLIGKEQLTWYTGERLTREEAAWNYKQIQESFVRTKVIKVKPVDYDMEWPWRKMGSSICNNTKQCWTQGPTPKEFNAWLKSPSGNRPKYYDLPQWWINNLRDDFKRFHGENCYYPMYLRNKNELPESD